MYIVTHSFIISFFLSILFPSRLNLSFPFVPSFYFFYLSSLFFFSFNCSSFIYKLPCSESSKLSPVLDLSLHPLVLLFIKMFFFK